jgi:hypothetical protein
MWLTNDTPFYLVPNYYCQNEDKPPYFRQPKKNQADSCTNYSVSQERDFIHHPILGSGMWKLSLHTYLNSPAYNSLKVMAQEEYNFATI